VAEIINLRRARKAKARAEQAATADANRIAFGRTKAEKAAAAAEAAQRDAVLDGARRQADQNTD
jgi:hypothetical protein